MGIIDSATSAVGAASSVKSLLDSGPASALSSVTDAVSGAVDAVGSFLTKLTEPTAPLRNPLSSYATYDYILGLTVLTTEEINFPDSTYMSGKRMVPLICKSANADPNNRVNTEYGKFDFFIDNLTVEANIGFSDYKNSSITTLEFEVTEPYSALMFPLALQTAAKKAKHNNWRDAVYMLTIEFRGNKEDGTMQSIPKTTRYIPIRITKMTIKTTERGTHYQVSAFASNDQAQTKEFSQFKTDVSIKGKTVQEILQTGPQSLQAVVNQRLQMLKTKKVVEDPDEIIILFPEKIESAATATSNAGPAEQNKSATASTSSSASTSDVYKKLGVSIGVNKTQVQPEGQCNEIGKSESGLSIARKGKTPMSKPGVVYDEKTGIYKQGSIQFDPKEGNYSFSQAQDIPTAINEVILSSGYVDKSLDVSNVDANGMRGWWTIDKQVYYKSTSANEKKTGTASRIIVYRVIPYKAHSSALPATNANPPGYKNLTKTVAKTYDYIYTGKNTEVLKFEIDFSVSFSNLLAADSGIANIDNKRVAETSGQEQKVVESSGLQDGNATEKNATPGSTKSLVLEMSSDNKGGAAPDLPINRAARSFHEALTKNVDMMELNLEIIGDPFWLPQSGMGNYTAKPSSRPGVASDGGVMFQTTQIATYVNFRTPLDINQNTGLYDFGKSTKTGSVVEFSGLYNVTRATSTFRAGRFTQVLKGFRYQGQERTTVDTSSMTINANEPDINAPAEKSDTNNPQTNNSTGTKA